MSITPSWKFRIYSHDIWSYRCIWWITQKAVTLLAIVDKIHSSHCYATLWLRIDRDWRFAFSADDGEVPFSWWCGGCLARHLYNGDQGKWHIYHAETIPPPWRHLSKSKSCSTPMDSELHRWQSCHLSYPMMSPMNSQHSHSGFSSLEGTSETSYAKLSTQIPQRPYGTSPR